MKQYTYTVILCLALSACASDPTVIRVKKGNESKLSCKELLLEYAEAEQAKKNARADDRFMLKHMNPFSVPFSIYRMNKAESAAVERMQYLQQIMQSKQCIGKHAASSGRRPVSNTPYMQQNTQQERYSYPPKQPSSQPYSYGQQPPQQPTGYGNGRTTGYPTRSQGTNTQNNNFRYPKPPSESPSGSTDSGSFNPPSYDPRLLDKYDQLLPQDVYGDTGGF